MSSTNPKHSPNALNIAVDPLSYVDRLEHRQLDQIKGVVIHCTELPELSEARAFGERILYQGTRTGNSGHFYITREGDIHQFVPLERVAHHVSGFNTPTIGIELINLGRYPKWHEVDQQDDGEAYSDAQIASLLTLLNKLQADLPSVEYITGHEDLDQRMVPASDDPNKKVRRRRDPGPLFPWDQVVAGTELRRVYGPEELDH